MPTEKGRLTYGNDQGGLEKIGIKTKDFLASFPKNDALYLTLFIEIVNIVLGTSGLLFVDDRNCGGRPGRLRPQTARRGAVSAYHDR